MENYEKKYKEALETARKINSGEGVAAPKDWSIPEVIFPELKDSENKRIKTNITRLLFKTFCDGLMYGMFFYHGENLHRVTSIEGLEETVNGIYLIKECKPCLHSIPNLTEEEQTQLGRLLGAASYKILKGDYSYLKELLEYVYKNHIDLFGLIPKGLAIEAPKELYKS